MSIDIQKLLCLILSTWSKVSFDILKAIFSFLVQEQSLRLWAHKKSFVLFSKIILPIFQEKGILGLIFKNQTLNSSKSDKKAQKVKNYAKVEQYSHLKTEYISRGATGFSLISLNWSSKIHRQDTDKGKAAFWSFIIIENFSKENYKVTL